MVAWSPVAYDVSVVCLSLSSFSISLAGQWPVAVGCKPPSLGTERTLDLWSLVLWVGAKSKNVFFCLLGFRCPNRLFGAARLLL